MTRKQCQMKNNKAVNCSFLALLFVVLQFTNAIADRYEYSAEVNVYIPEGDSAGVRDTIFIPVHLQISDINFYVGVGRPDQAWAEAVLVDVFSPQRARVRLNDWDHTEIFFYNVWYDTQRQVDGPGSLTDYNGGDSYGPWEMFCFDPFQGQSLTWFTWRIEVIGTPLEGVTETPTPMDYAINGVYPNPFNSTMVVEYTVPSPSNVRFEVYDISGRKVRTLLDDEMDTGSHRIIWDGTAGDGVTLASGVYFIRMVSGDQIRAVRATLLK
jgi:hypothetical protein